MNNEAMHHMLITMQTHADNEAAKSVVSAARLKLEDLLIMGTPPMTQEEKDLPMKFERIKAYSDRTGASISLSHVVVNRGFVNSTREKKSTSV